MALVQDMLSSQLEHGWLGGPYPSSVSESGQRFADAVSQWLALGQAAGFPCATALARRAELAATAAAALSLQSAAAAGAQLALAVASYIAGQSFGAGAAGFPAAAPAAVAEVSAVFADTASPVAARAQRIATACTLMAATTVVAGPPPFPGPIV